MDLYYDRYLELESRFKVIYPESPNATYTSLLNYSDDLNKPFQRWYRYKEGYSVELVEHLIREYAQRKEGIILEIILAYLIQRAGIIKKCAFAV